MTHSPAFWAAYVHSVDPHAVSSFWGQMQGKDWEAAETIAYRVLLGLNWAHADAVNRAHALCAKDSVIRNGIGD